MDITFKCDKCGQSIAIDETGAGTVVNCPKCDAFLRVPSRGDKEAAQPAPTIVRLPPDEMQKPDEKKCPFCAETIKAEAIVCRFCGRDLVDKRLTEAVARRVQGPTKSDSPLSGEPEWVAELSRANTPARQTQRARDLSDSVSEGNIAAGYIVALIVPFIGFFVGIYLIAKKQPGHGVACMAISVVACLFWIAALNGC